MLAGAPSRIAAALLGVLAVSQPARADEPVLVEFHYTPVANLQMAIWLEDKNGAHALDVLVTQATGKYGIGNRPGRWDFVSSWRAPYGPRTSVLPVWAHRRGKSYQRIIFHDDNPIDFESLGWHETTSSSESYFCIPLTPEANETVLVDTMTCPSPKNFSTDKGRFDPDGGTSVYPPRNDLITFSVGLDAEDTKQYGSINDLDAVTAATPVGDKPEFTSLLLAPELVARGPLTAYIEVNLEHDENSHYDYDREDDHYVDPRLPAYGVEYLGQPSVVFKVEFDPHRRKFTGVTNYAGHGDWNGATGSLHPPDGTISESDGSGADRLKSMTKNGDTFRWGVFSYGSEDGGSTTGDDTDGTDTTGDDPDGGDPTTGDPGGGWGQCRPGALAPIEDLVVASTDFDRARVSFRLPSQGDPAFALKAVHVYHINGDMEFTEDLLGAAHINSFSAAELAATSGVVSLEVEQLWGDYTYQFAVVYEDMCTRRSALATTSVTTPAQKFQTVDTFCFVATAAFGVPWAPQVAALRSFRDTYLKPSATGIDLVRFYYTYSPPLAGVIHGEPLLRGIARVVLQPVADAARLATAPAGG